MALLDDLLDRLSEVRGADLFVTVGVPPKMTVDGRMMDAGTEPLRSADVAAIVAPLIHDPAAFAAKPELDVARRSTRGDRYRINVYRQRGEYALVARRIRGSVLGLQALRLPPVLGEMVLAQKGLVLVTGATGSGKSSTVAAMIDHRNRERSGHIVTLEDPIEFLHEHRMSIVSQREIGVDTASFADALRSALRQAPDVLVVGEIRDRETAEAALQFAETGHLVMATQHSTNASQTLERLVGLFPADRHVQLLTLLSLNVRGIVCQRLVPTRDGSRAAAVEILLPTARIRDLVKKGDVAGVRCAIGEGAKDGMTTFDQSLLRLLQAGRITLDDAVANADSPNDLRLGVSLGATRKVDSGIRIV